MALAEYLRMPVTQRFSEWASEVDTLCRHYLACSWQDLCGEEHPLRRAYGAGDTPLAFVKWWAEKYDLCVVRAFLVNQR